MHEGKVFGDKQTNNCVLILARLIGREDIGGASIFPLIESLLSKATFITMA